MNVTAELQAKLHAAEVRLVLMDQALLEDADKAELRRLTEALKQISQVIEPSRIEPHEVRRKVQATTGNSGVGPRAIVLSGPGNVRTVGLLACRG